LKIHIQLCQVHYNIIFKFVKLSGAFNYLCAFSIGNRNCNVATKDIEENRQKTAG
jgi:hypothetical protein